MRENELLRKIAKGETEYWEELIGMYYEDILRYCIYHAPDKTAAEDAVQETFLKVIRYMPNYRHRGKFRAFLYKVAANTAKTSGGNVQGKNGLIQTVRHRMARKSCLKK